MHACVRSCYGIVKTLCCIHLLWCWFTRADEVSGEWWPLHLMWCMRDGLLDMNKQFLLTKHSQGLSWHMFQKHLSSVCDVHCLYMCTLHVQWDIGRWCRFQHYELDFAKIPHETAIYTKKNEDRKKKCSQNYCWGKTWRRELGGCFTSAFWKLPKNEICMQCKLYFKDGGILSQE